MQNIDQELLQKLKAQLQEKKVKLTAQIAELKKPVDMGDDIDSFDEETDEAEEFSANLGMAEELKKSLQRINEALNNIQTNTYGKCRACEGQISIAHLEADPETELCKDCKVNERSK